MPKNPHATFFYDESKVRRTYASSIIKQHSVLAFSPYYQGLHLRAGYHASAFTYPLCHIIKTLFTTARIVQGIFLLVPAVFNDPKKALPEVLLGIGNELITMIANVINIAASIISLLTRTLATIFNFGYDHGHQSKYREFYTNLNNANELRGHLNYVENYLSQEDVAEQDPWLYASTTALSI